MNVEITWFTNGNSFIQDKERYAGVAVVSNTEPQSARMSAQKTELTALTKALKPTKDKRHR